jgi:Flp pilus assembly protein TadD
MWQGLANCYSKLSRHTDAIKAYKRAVIGGSTDLSILVTLASLLEQEGDIKSAASFQYQIISETTIPGTGELTPMAAKAHLWLARMEIKNGDFDAAERHVNESLKGHYVCLPYFVLFGIDWFRNWKRREHCRERYGNSSLAKNQ